MVLFPSSRGNWAIGCVTIHDGVLTPKLRSVQNVLYVYHAMISASTSAGQLHRALQKQPYE
eukprot:scaffold310263_cov39-Prasinocladus_malaysianus.AAC.1